MACCWGQAFLAALCLLSISHVADAQTCSASSRCPTPGSTGLCCSSSGFCGGNSLTDPSDPWCGTGCNPAAGKCFGSAGTASPPPGSSTGGCTYTVKSGDVCCRIAYDLGTVVQTLYDLNPAIETTSNFQCTNLQPGQVLSIPCGLPGPGKSPKPETNKACKAFNCGTYYDSTGNCPTTTCTDSIKNGAETDVDCGGSTCPKCALNKLCASASDCASNFCSGGRCQAPATCTDLIKNGAETDVDCGGGTCPKCALNKLCSAAADCTSNFCSGGRCQTPAVLPTCTDGKKNGAETDVDCGGGTCPKCKNTYFCVANADCASNYCFGNVCTAASSCTDGIMNGAETDVDCGGGACPKCSDVCTPFKCAINSDCTSNFCLGGYCVPKPKPSPPSPPPPKPPSPPPPKPPSPPPPSPPPRPPSPPSPPKPICTVKVTKSDTCCSIAKARGSCVANLIKLNPWVESFTTAKCQNVQVGDTLVVPCTPDGCAAETCSPTCRYTIQKGDTCGCIAKTLGINTATLFGMNSWIQTDKPSCQNLCVGCFIQYPCTPTAAQVTGADAAAVCLAPPPPSPPCYGPSCTGPDTVCVPDQTPAICKQAASTFGLPGACFSIVTGLSNIPSTCPCMCAGICSAGSCGDGVCSTGAVKATCGTCNCKTVPPVPILPPAPPPATPACSEAWAPQIYISNPSLTVSAGMCISVNASGAVVFKACADRTSDDLFTYGASFFFTFANIKHVKTGKCFSLQSSTSSVTVPNPDGTGDITTIITSFKLVLATCDNSDSQRWTYSYYLGLLLCKTGHFLGAAKSDSMAPGTSFIGYPTDASGAITVNAYSKLSRSWILWPITTPKCGFTGAVVALQPDTNTHTVSVTGVTFPAPLGAIPVVATPSSLPKNLQMCLDATTIKVFGGKIYGMVSFLPCVDGKASQYVQTVAYNSLDWSQSQIGDASFKVTNIPSGWPGGQFFITFPKVKPNVCFDIYRSMGLNVAVIAYECHPNWTPGNQLWTVDWSRGHVRSVIPAGVDVYGGGQGTKGSPVCAHFNPNSMDVFSSNCTGDAASNKFLWKFQVADQMGSQVNSATLMTVG